MSTKTHPRQIPTISVSFPIDVDWLTGQLQELQQSFPLIRLNIFGYEDEATRLAIALYDNAAGAYQDTLYVPNDDEDAESVIETSTLLDTDAIEVVMENIETLISLLSDDGDVTGEEFVVALPDLSEKIPMEDFEAWGNGLMQTIKDVSEARLGETFIATGGELYGMDMRQSMASVTVIGDVSKLMVNDNTAEGEEKAVAMFDAIRQNNPDLDIVENEDGSYTAKVNLARLDFIPQVIFAIISGNGLVETPPQPELPITETTEEEYDTH